MPADGRIASNGRTQLGHRGVWGLREAEALALAGRQHGVITHSQLRSLGFSAAAIRHRAAAGRLHTVHRGVYALGRPDLSVEGTWMAATLACGPGALLSHASSAALHGLLPTARATVDVTIPRRVGISRSGISVHRSTFLERLSLPRCTGSRARQSPALCSIWRPSCHNRPWREPASRPKSCGCSIGLPWRSCSAAPRGAAAFAAFALSWHLPAWRDFRGASSSGGFSPFVGKPPYPAQQ